ncbi:MAG: 50S ribosomal protein L5 [Candidatus Parcubacteria bacterium]|nr:50S ribosomal protein L5 [Candidatus Parcubacteria bacterium]
METIKDREKKAFELMKSEFGYKNPMQAPRLAKVIISSGTGKSKDPKRNDLVIDRLTKITGQKPSLRGAKKSIASFKVREGDPVGVMVTLRSGRMYGFLDKLINVAIPRMKDFRGLETKAIDEIGNYTMGLREHTIFTEATNEDLKDVFGLAITVVTTAKNAKEAKAFLDILGFPFKKVEAK